MASGSVLLAVTDAALQPLKAPEGQSEGHNHMAMESDAKHSHGGRNGECGYQIFSPLPSDNDNSMFSDTPVRNTMHTPKTAGAGKFPGEDPINKDNDNSENPQLGSRDITTLPRSTNIASESTTLSPLTISAQDIEAGSLDFTELATGLETSTINSTHLLPSMPLQKSGSLRDVSTPPLGGIPVRVRVSAGKLREIPSPHSTDSNNASWCSTPRALTPIVDFSQGNREGGHSKSAHKSLKQGILLAKMQEESLLYISDDSLIVSTTGVQKDTTRDVKAKLQSKAGEENGVISPPIIYLNSQKPQSSTTESASSGPPVMFSKEECMTELPGDNVLKFYPSHALALSGHPTNYEQHECAAGMPPYPAETKSGQSHAPLDFVEAAKLAATCAAAAATAALASADKPPRETEGRNTLVDGLQEVDGPSIPLNTNTIPHAQDSSKVHHKYGIVARTGNAMDENKVHKGRTLFIPTKERDYDDESCSDDENTLSVPIHERGKPRHSNKDVYKTSHPTNSWPAKKNTERKIKELHSKLLSSPPPSYSHVHSADLLRRLQRLEELQHAHNVASIKGLEGGESATHRNANNANKTEGPLLFQNTPHLEDNQSMVVGKTLQQQDAPISQHTVTAGPRTNSTDKIHGTSLRVVPPPLFLHKLRSATADDDHRGHVITRAAKVLSEVQHARDQLEMECAFMEANDQVSPHQSTSSGIAELASAAEISRKVTTILGQLELAQRKQSAEERLPPHQEQTINCGSQPVKGIKRKSGLKPGGKIPSKETPTKSAATIAAKKSALLASNARRRKMKTTMHEQEEKLIVLSPHEAQQSATSSLLDAPSAPSKAPPPSLPLLHSRLTTQSIYHPTGQPSHLPHHTHHSQTCAVPPNVEPQGFAMAIPLGAPYIVDTHVARYPPTEPMRESGVKLEGPEMADAWLQTSGIFQAQSAGFHSDRLVVETLPGVDIPGNHDTASMASPAKSPVQQHLQDNSTGYTAVRDITVDSESSEEQPSVHREMIISLEGNQDPSTGPPYEGPTFPPRPPSTCGHNSGETLSSDELNGRLREHLEEKAIEWVQQELLARVLAEVDLPGDPITSVYSKHDGSSNSCSTCTPPPEPREAAIAPLLGQSGLQLFIDSGVPVDGDLVQRLVREVVLAKAAEVVRGTEVVGGGTEDEGRSPTEDQEFSYTPPESGSIDSESTTPLLSTPQPTPPLSPSPQHSPTPHRLLAEAVLPSLPLAVATPTATPSSSLSVEEVPSETLNTPQVTEDEQDTMTTQTPSEPSTRGGMDRTHHSIPTPSVTPPNNPISPGSPPQSQEISEQQPPVMTAVAAHTQDFSESSSSSTSAPECSRTLTTSSMTDREISMGEYVLQRPLLQVVANPSLSEGEVPWSPGDARWYSLHATKLGKGAHLRKKKEGKGKHGGARETLTAFMDLKSTPEPSSDSSADSLQSDSKVLSVGEAHAQRPIKHSDDPFEKFLSKLNVSPPADSSTPTVPTFSHLEEDNTLSEIPSINDSTSLATDQVITPQVTGYHRRPKVPYHRQYPLRTHGRKSPGEKMAARGGHRQDHSFSLSEGEVAVRRGSRLRVKGSGTHSVASPGELRLPNKTRDGIDVINVSRTSVSLSKGVGLAREEDSAGRKLRISESAPTHLIIQVQQSTRHANSSTVTSSVTTSSTSSKKKHDVMQPHIIRPDIRISNLDSPTESLRGQRKTVEGTPPLESRPPATPPGSGMGADIPPLPTNEDGDIDTQYSSDFEFSSLSLPGFD